MTLREYRERLMSAGPIAARADEMLDDLRSEMGLKRKFGQGSLKLYGASGSSIVFQPVLAKKHSPGLRVQTYGKVPADRAARAREGVRRVGGTSHDVFCLIPTDILVDRWTQVRQGILEPFLE